MGGDKQVEMTGVTLDALGEAGGSEELVEGVADMLQLGVKILAVTIEPVLKTFEQVGRKISTVAGTVAMGGDGPEALFNEALITLRGTGEAALVEPGGGPGESVEESLAVAVVVASPGAVEALAEGEQQGFGGGGEWFVGISGGAHARSRLRVKRATGVGPAWARVLSAQPALGRLGLWGEDLKIKLLVECIYFLVAGGGEQFVGHVHEQSQIAGGVFAEGLLQSGGQ